MSRNGVENRGLVEGGTRYSASKLAIEKPNTMGRNFFHIPLAMKGFSDRILRIKTS